MDNIELLEIFSIVNDLKKKRQSEIKKNEEYLTEDIRRFKEDEVEKPRLDVLNNQLNDIREDENSETMKKLLLPLFELFVKCVINEIDDFKIILKIIEYNLENMISYINGNIPNFNFTLDASSTDTLSTDKLSGIIPKINKVERLISERESLVENLRSKYS